MIPANAWDQMFDVGYFLDYVQRVLFKSKRLPMRQLYTRDQRMLM